MCVWFLIDLYFFLHLLINLNAILTNLKARKVLETVSIEHGVTDGIKSYLFKLKFHFKLLIAFLHHI